MSYKQYLVNKGLKDSPEAYASYVREHFAFAKDMCPAVLDQQIRGTYNIRFINNAWM